jgi:hypothetical protein
VTFSNPLLLWGLALVALPVLIHLINLVRQRHVRWAAMEFLLASQRKNSRWIRIKELLLLLLRIGAIAAVVLVLAQPLINSSWGLGLGSEQIEHVVLLDDSYSMSDHWADTSAFAAAKQAIHRFAEQIAQHGSPQTFTLLRYSRFRAADGSAQPDLLKEVVNHDFPRQLEDRMQSWQPSHTDAGPARALSGARTLMGEADAARRVVYLFTDFRTKDWDEPGDTAAELARWTADGARIQFVSCVDAARPNLAITAIDPQPGTRAAGVALALNVTVKNFGAAPVRDVPIEIEQDGEGQTALKIDEILPGQSETRSFQTLFPAAGQHVVTVKLPSDAVAADNVRYAVLDLPPSVPVLVVDGDPSSPDARLLAAVLNPGGSVKTGVDVAIEPSSFLNSHPLDAYQVVYLTGVERLDDAAAESLDSYVRAGGGVAFFVGPRTNVAFYNGELYADGEGIFPAPLLAETQLIVDRLEKAPDLSVTDHPILRAFVGERNSFLSAVTIERFMLVPKTWQPAAGSQTHVVARLRNGSPLMIERHVDRGRIVATLTTAGPLWNNWARNPSFVVTVLQMQAWLARASTVPTSQPVATPIRVTVDASKYQPRIEFTPPPASDAPPMTIDMTTGADGLTASLADTNYAGVYQVLLRPVAGDPETRLFAVDVDADEGNLATVDGSQLATRLPNVQYALSSADQLAFSSRGEDRSNFSDLLLYMLVAMLVGEQALAYAASYHRQSAEGPRR